MSKKKAVPILVDPNQKHPRVYTYQGMRISTARKRAERRARRKAKRHTRR